MLMLGEEVRTPADIMFGISQVNHFTNEPASYVSWLRDVLHEAHEAARQVLQASQRRQKRYYDAKLFQRRYRPGDLLWVVDDSTKKGRCAKLHPPWKGPVLLTKVLGPVLFEVEDRKGLHVVHHDKVKLCRDRVVPFWLRRKRHDLLKLDDTLAYSQDETLPSSATPFSSTPDSGNHPEVPDGTELLPKDLEETLPYEDLLADLEATWLYGDDEDDIPDPAAVAVSSDGVGVLDEDVEDLGLESLFAEPLTSSRGRVRKVPGHLQDYVL